MDDEYWVRERQEALADPRSNDELVREALALDPDDHPYWEPVRLLQDRGSAEVLECARSLCGSAEAKERILGVRIVAQSQTRPKNLRDAALDLLLAMIEQEQEPAVLADIATALGHLTEPRTVGPLVRLKDHSDPEVRYGVVFGLLTQDDPRAIQALIELSSDGEAKIRDWATFGLGTQIDTDTEEIRAALAARLSDPDDDTRAEAIMGLARRHDSRVVEPLLEELMRPEASTLLLEAAEKCGDPRLLPALLSWKDVVPALCADVLEAAIRHCGGEPGHVGSNA